MIKGIKINRHHYDFIDVSPKAIRQSGFRSPSENFREILRHYTQANKKKTSENIYKDIREKHGLFVLCLATSR